MTYAAVRRIVIPVLTAAALVGGSAPALAVQRPQNPPRQGTAATAQPSEPLPPDDDQSAERTRQQLEQLFERYPPSVGRVFKLDPSLMSNPSYLTPYPGLSTFLAQHPEIVRNPGYFLENIENPNTFYNDPRRREREEMLAILAGVGVFIAFLVIIGVLTWLIRLVVTHRRWNRLSKVQFETHTKLLDRFTSNDELLAYVQTPGGPPISRVCADPDAGCTARHGRAPFQDPVVRSGRDRAAGRRLRLPPGEPAVQRGARPPVHRCRNPVAGVRRRIHRVRTGCLRVIEEAGAPRTSCRRTCVI